MTLLQEKLLLHEWEIRLMYDKLPRHTLAKVGLHPDIRIAEITFNKVMIGKHKYVNDSQ